MTATAHIANKQNESEDAKPLPAHDRPHAILRFASLIAGLLPAWALAGPAIGQFEVKDLESIPGQIQLQSQNAHMFGQPERNYRHDNAETEYDDNTITRQRHALELEFGITPRLKSRIGIEYEKERVDEPASPARADAFDALKLSEYGGELIVILDPIQDQDWGFGLVTEYERPTDNDEASTLLVGGIFQANHGRWRNNVNLYLVKFLGGSRPRDSKLDFAYASQFAYVLDAHWQLALEAYGTIDRLGGSGSPSEEARRFGDHDQHRAGPLLYYSGHLGGDEEDGGVELLLGAGILMGLNHNTPDTTFKWTVEVEF